MSSDILNPKDGFTFIWRIHNFRYISCTEFQNVTSPPFIPNPMESTQWNLTVFPRNKGHENYLYCAIQKIPVEKAPEFSTSNIEVAFLASDGSEIKSWIVKENELLSRKKISSPVLYVNTNEVLNGKKQYVGEDVLTIQCKMWKDGFLRCKPERIYARSRLCIERALFIQTIEQFSSKTNQPNEWNIASKATPSLVMGVKTCLVIESDNDQKMRMIIEVNETPKPINYLCNMYLLSSVGKKIQCGIADTRCKSIEKGILDVPLLFSKKELLEKKCEYLPKDVMYLQFEFHFANGNVLSEIEQTEYDLNLMSRNTEVTEEFHTLGSLSNDLYCWYKKQDLCDVQLKTPTKCFLAHKLILCARSSVFKSMLTNEGRMNNADCIEIDDIDEDILSKFLEYLYTGHLKKLQWETASKLYNVAKKYDVQLLKMKCGILLMQAVTTSNACEILSLADTSEDSLLKNSVVDFIVEHDQEIFLSDAWTALMQSNRQLAWQTVLSKYNKTQEI